MTDYSTRTYRDLLGMRDYEIRAEIERARDVAGFSDSMQSDGVVARFGFSLAEAVTDRLPDFVEDRLFG